MRSSLILGAILSLVCMPAFAADVLSEPPIDTSQASYDWSGLSIGLKAGIAGTDIIYDADVGGTPLNLETNGWGVAAGGEVGYQYQVGNFVLGAVVSADYLDANNELSFDGLGVTASASTTTDYLIAGQLKAGLAFENVLVYVTGGYGLSGATTEYSIPGEAGSFDTDHDGLVLGGGFDVGVSDNVSLGLNALWFDASEETVASGVGYDVTTDPDIWTVQGTAKYRF